MRALVIPLVLAMSATGCTKVRSMFDGGDEEVVSDKDSCADARKLEQAKDYDRARRAYADCLATGTGHVDSHAAYQKILTLEDGPEAARETYDEIVATNDNVVTRHAHARLLERDERITSLERIIADHPAFAPAYYELSLDYSAARMGQRALADQAQEKRHLEAFLHHATGKDFVDYFVDYDKADEQVKDAQGRLSQLASVDLSALDNPITLTATPTGVGWMLYFQIAEPASATFYRLRDETEFTKADGQLVTIPFGPASKVIDVKYEDQGGAMRGPFEIVHEPRSALDEWAKSTLETMPAFWVSLRDFGGRKIIYWTTLLVYRCGLEAVEYGVDSMTPTQRYEPGKCDLGDPSAIKDELEMMTTSLPHETEFVSIRLVYRDGTKSKVQKFESGPPE